MRQASPSRRSSSLPRFVAVFMIAVMSLAVAAPASANPRYAAIVIDANTGRTLFASNADAPRFPASLTKMMTVYMIFEAIAAGRIRLDSRVPFSAQAAARPPTKLGVRAGGSITVEQAILGLVTRSANDAAAAIGELLAGSEANFARQMTAKARSLGMNSTTFRNASGLPDNEQRTTARDMAILGIALREHFPNHYHYFSTRSFNFSGTRINNHNRLLGRVRGVDGIKTGFIRASGFNLVTSVQDSGRNVVAVVMGGRTGASRDAHMAELLSRHLPQASTRGGGAVVAARRIQPGATVAAAAVALPGRGAPVPEFRPTERVMETKATTTELAYAQPVQARIPAAAIPAPAGRAEAHNETAPQVDPVLTATTRPQGWVIQVASLPSEPEAIAFLTRMTKEASGVVGSASPFTEVFDHKGSTFYRARFAGFTGKDAAWKACEQLKKRNIGCFAVQQ